jgi:hypothetical protein
VPGRTRAKVGDPRAVTSASAPERTKLVRRLVTPEGVRTPEGRSATVAILLPVGVSAPFGDLFSACSAGRPSPDGREDAAG